ncbi:type II toxin-antitoxin system VapC family toxin [Thermococcus waiotapuensis]|uniref:Type II toxin-antitoxin system VapC family toxin n=1 Tax=Thermococcus waiotapuensis TaxID=90909 RepID=A0AAE4NUP3_9EURY|nr:type II toxin-antitoxin system VapC family toxin [Thermococcus waiotapuensis]MDV3103459.1 type II toxin-antitoxin system VapC family toxin [Thermococcus waiotapuensis]
MRFMDANVFLYAVIKPKGNVPENILERKRKAKQILKRVENGEEIVTTVVHLSEVANILEAKLGLSFALDFLEELLTAKNITVLPVSTEDYLRSLIVAKEHRISVNDALAYLKMKELGIREIYTFDKHFLNLDVRVLAE